MNEKDADPVACLQAVADASRLRLLRVLQREELNVQELVTILELRQPSVSRHLAVLRDAGWVRQRREGTRSWYRAEPAAGPAAGVDLQRAVAAIAGRVDGAEDDDRRLAAVVAARELRARELFTGAVDHWDRIRSQYEHPDLQVAMVGALAPPGLRVIDVGTGTGALLPLLAQAAASVVAVDSSRSLLAGARGRCRTAGCRNVWFHQADVRALPFADGSFAAAYASMVLHHVPDPQAALGELARVVRPGGRVVVVEFTRHNLGWMRQQLAHRWLGFEREQLAAWFAAVGLEPRQWLQRRRTADDAVAGLTAASREGYAWPDVLLAVAVRDDSSDGDRAAVAGTARRNPRSIGHHGPSA